SRLLGYRPRLLRLEFGAARTLAAEIGEHGGHERADGEHRAADGDLAGAHHRAARGEFARVLLGEEPFGRLARLALPAQIPAALDDTAQDIMRELDATHVQALFDAQQAAVDQGRQRIGAGAHRLEAADKALLCDVLAEAGSRQELIFDYLAHGRLLVGERSLVEVAQDTGVRAGEQVQGNLVASLGYAGIVELAAN